MKVKVVKWCRKKWNEHNLMYIYHKQCETKQKNQWNSSNGQLHWFPIDFLWKWSIMDQNYANANAFFSDCKSSWRTWGPWGRCCTGNLELKKGEGLKYSDNPEAVQVRHRYGVTTGCTATMILTPSQGMQGRTCWWLGILCIRQPRSQRLSLWL